MADLEAILKGGARQVHEANFEGLRSRSVSEEEVKFGYAVTGLMDPRRTLTNAGAMLGCVLVFTKRVRY